MSECNSLLLYSFDWPISLERGEKGCNDGILERGSFADVVLPFVAEGVSDGVIDDVLFTSSFFFSSTTTFSSFFAGVFSSFTAGAILLGVEAAFEGADSFVTGTGAAAVDDVAAAGGAEAFLRKGRCRGSPWKGPISTPAIAS